MNERANTIPAQRRVSGQERPPRCLECGYQLLGLQEPVCPECGRPFDPKNKSTFSRKGPFIWYLYWWPGALLAISAGFIWCVGFYIKGELGWGIFVAVPFMVGSLVGFRPSPKRRVGLYILMVIGSICATILVGLLVVGEFAGVFCGVILMLFFLVPTVGGLYFGILSSRVLALAPRATRFSQREHLPFIALMLLLPGLVHMVEKAFAPPIAIQTVSTSKVLEMDRMQAWNTWVFYEEVEHDRPLLLRLGLPTPSHVEGKIQGVGDRQICVYTGDARLVKMATEVTPGERLAFEVIGQHNFEDNSIRLIDGAFDFKAVGEEQTQVTLTTRYEPLLRPRAVWEPIEHVFAGQLHKHVLKGMEQPAGNDQYAQTTTEPKP